MITRTTTTLIAAVVLTAALSIPSGGARAEDALDARLEELDEALDLTPSQEKRIRKLFEERREIGEHPRSRREPGERRGGERGSAAFSQQPRLDEEIEAVLVPKQVEKYRAYKRAKTVEKRLTLLENRLGLTDEQKTKIRSILEDEAEKMEDFTGNRRPGSRNARRELFSRLREIRGETDRNIREVLTDEQSKEYEDMVKKAREESRGRRRR